MPASNYGDEHRIFLQGLMCRGILDAKEVNRLLEVALENCKIDIPDQKTEKQKLLLQIITEINENLGDLDLMIKKGVDEDDGTNYFMLINVSQRGGGQGGDALATVQSQFSAVELEYLRLLASRILQNQQKSIKSTPALHLIREVPGNENMRYSMAQGEQMIQMCVDNKWLKIVDTGRVALGVRFIGELEGWIMHTLGEDVDKCKVCRKIVLRGVGCSCGMEYHRNCANRMAKATGGTMKCLGCDSSVNIEAETVDQEERTEEQDSD